MTTPAEKLEEDLRELKESVNELLEKLESPDDADEGASYTPMEVSTGERQTIVHWIELPITADGTTYSNAADVVTFADAEAIFLKSAQDRDEDNTSATHDRNVSHGDIMVLGSRPDTWICYVAQVDRYAGEPRWGFQSEDPTEDLLALTETLGSDSHANREFIIWTNKTGTCDPDTYETVGETDSPNTLPTADADTNFDDGTVADAKISAGDYSCIKKLEFENKKILQNECGTVVLQVDGSGGQNVDFFGFSDDPGDVKTTSVTLLTDLVHIDDDTWEKHMATLTFECGLLTGVATSSESGVSTESPTTVCITEVLDESHAPSAEYTKHSSEINGKAAWVDSGEYLFWDDTNDRWIYNTGTSISSPTAYQSESSTWPWDGTWTSSLGSESYTIIVTEGACP